MPETEFEGGIALNKEKTNRIYFIDTLEAIAIFFVIFYHVFSTSVDVRSYDHIGSYYIKSCLCVSIPLFLLTNGGLLFNKKFSLKKHILKMCRLVFLVCIWDVINVTVKMFVYQEALSFTEYIHKLWRFESGWSNQLWFLMALFVLYSFFPLLKYTYDYGKKAFLFFFIIIFAAVFGNSFLNMIMRIGLVIAGRSVPLEEINFLNQFDPVRGLYAYTFAYFILGAFLFQKIDIIKEKVKPVYAVIGYLISITFLTLYGVMISVETQSVWDTVSSAFSTIFALAASICVYRLSLLCSDSSKSSVRKVIQKISQNSLGIYLFQSLLADVCYTYYIKLPVSQNLLGDLIFAASLLGICCLMTSLCKKVPYLRAICIL